MVSFRALGDTTKKLQNVSKYYIIPLICSVVWGVLLILNLTEPENSKEPFDDPKLVVSTIFGGITLVSGLYLANKNNQLENTSPKFLNNKLK